MLVFWRKFEKSKTKAQKKKKKKKIMKLFYSGFLFVFWKTSVAQATTRIA